MGRRKKDEAGFLLLLMVQHSGHSDIHHSPDSSTIHDSAILVLRGAEKRERLRP